MIGNIKAWKGQETLVRAMAIVSDGNVPASDASSSETRPRLTATTSAKPARARVVARARPADRSSPAYQKNVADFLMMVDVVVHASVLPEPFGRVILEAMACRKPVIGARAGAIPEIIEEGITGLTFPPGDADALAEAILRLLRDPARGGAARRQRLSTARVGSRLPATSRPPNSSTRRLLGAD